MVRLVDLPCRENVVPLVWPMGEGAALYPVEAHYGERGNGFSLEQHKYVSDTPQIHPQDPTKKVCIRQHIPLQGVSSARGRTRGLEGGACAVPPG